MTEPRTFSTSSLELTASRRRPSIERASAPKRVLQLGRERSFRFATRLSSRGVPRASLPEFLAGRLRLPRKTLSSAFLMLAILMG